MDSTLSVKEYGKMKYIVRFPKEYTAGKKYPVIIFLHGAGSRGDDITPLANNPFFSITKGHNDFPFVCVAPQCSQNTWFDMFEQLKNFAEFVISSEFCDESRVYLMGASMGGYATWQLAMSMPERFAAIVPICGGGMYWNAGRLADVPVWAFHGAKDPEVLLRESEIMVKCVNNSGGKANLTVYPENEHDAWSDTYSNPEVFKWLLSHKNKNTIPAADKYTDSKIYG